MIVAHSGDWAICTPKKTASQSLAGMLADVAFVAPDPHAMTWDGAGERLMVVRDPFARLNSMFWYQQAEGNAAFGRPFEPRLWLEAFLRLRPQRAKSRLAEWLHTQSEIAAQFGPTRVFRLEDGLSRVVSYLGLDVAEQRRNVTARKHLRPTGYAETFSGCGWLVGEVAALFEPDMRTWYGDLLR